MYRKLTTVNTTWRVLGRHAYLFSYAPFQKSEDTQPRTDGSPMPAGLAPGAGLDSERIDTWERLSTRNTKRLLFSRRSANPRFRFGAGRNWLVVLGLGEEVNILCGGNGIAIRGPDSCGYGGIAGGHSRDYAVRVDGSDAGVAGRPGRLAGNIINAPRVGVGGNGERLERMANGEVRISSDDVKQEGVRQGRARGDALG